MLNIHIIQLINVNLIFNMSEDGSEILTITGIFVFLINMQSTHTNCYFPTWL